MIKAVSFLSLDLSTQRLTNFFVCTTIWSFFIVSMNSPPIFL